jgi:hypothetical protein
VSGSLLVDGSGKLIVGQLQASSSDQIFQAENSFKGKIYGFNMWDTVKLSSEILSLSKQCSCEPGNLIDWRMFMVKESNGAINKAMPSICTSKYYTHKWPLLHELSKNSFYYSFW